MSTFNGLRDIFGNRIIKGDIVLYSGSKGFELACVKEIRVVNDRVHSVHLVHPYKDKVKTKRHNDYQQEYIVLMGLKLEHYEGMLLNFTDDYVKKMRNIQRKIE